MMQMWGIHLAQDRGPWQVHVSIVMKLKAPQQMMQMWGIHLAHDRRQWQDHVSTVMKLKAP
jgi:hypothetical protein